MENTNMKKTKVKGKLQAKMYKSKIKEFWRCSKDVLINDNMFTTFEK